MSDLPKFKPGDRVAHPHRPEWGEGVVDQATSIFHDGRAAQRLVVVFANYGRVTINTAVAGLVPSSNGARAAMQAPPATATQVIEAPAPPGGGWLAKLTHSNPKGELWRLPEALTDPFASLAVRLAATLDTFRYTGDPRNPASGRSVLEWAMAQTGMNDPLVKYTRHELEQAFPRYARNRDVHLVDLVRTIKREGRMEVLEQVRGRELLPAARTALERAVRA
jgi:hypothetical protein